jgi:DNA-binding response OmpR family regulator
MRVLLVEDDFRLARALVTALRNQEYDVAHVMTGADALAAPAADLVLLDLGLPDVDGFALCRQLRERSDAGIIVLTARAEERDRVAGLRGGADDYVVKPFGFPELQARIEAVLRRARPRPAGVHAVGRLRVDVDGHTAFVGTSEVALTNIEFQLLTMLAAEPGRTVRSDRMLAEVWHTTWPPMRRTLHVHMSTLRGKLGEAARMIRTVRGVGYRLSAAEEEAG